MSYENYLFAVLEKKAARFMREDQQDQKDTVTVDVPLLIRLLELAREDIKSDAELHKVVERILDIKDNGTLTMDDYELIVPSEAPAQLPAPSNNFDEDLSSLRKLAGL